MRRLILIGTLLAAMPALADPPLNTYLPEPDLLTAQIRSKAEAVEMGNRDMLPPMYWNVIACLDGTAYIEIEPAARPGLPGNDFSANPIPVTVIDGKAAYGAPTGLTDAEKAALVTFSALVKSGCLSAPP